MKRTLVGLLGLLAVLVAHDHALADADVTVDRPVAQNAVSLHLLSLGARSLAFEYERFVLPPKLSIVGGIGFRNSAGGDFRANTLALGAEARYWFTGRAAWSRLGPGNMAGAYVSGRIDASRTATKDEVVDESLATTITIAESISAGYRFVAWGKLEITPSIGLSVRTEIDTSGRLSPWTRGAAVAGLTIGWLF